MGRDGRKFVKFDPFAKGSGDQEWTLPGDASSDFHIEFSTSFTVLSKKSKSSQISSNHNDHYLNANQRRESNADKKTSAIHELIREDNSKRESQVRENVANKTRKL